MAGGYSAKDIEKAVSAAVSSDLSKFQPQPKDGSSGDDFVDAMPKRQVGLLSFYNNTFYVCIIARKEATRREDINVQ